MQPFFGSVNIAHWIRDKAGQQYNAVVGMIEIKDASDVWGFKLGRSESAWVAVVSGSKEKCYIPGTEVYAILQHDPDGVTAHDSLVLK